MGRKIPGRKHRGIRNPEKQKAEKLKNLKDKINAPPANPDEQHVPKSLERLIELKNKAKDIRKKKIKKGDGKPQRRHQFERLPGEKDSQFLHRINKACENVKREAAFEIKYGVKIVKNKETGEVEEIVKRPKDELELHIEKLKAEKQGKKKRQRPSDEPKLSKSQKRQKKLKEKKMKRLLHHHDNVEVSRDNVRFGETVHAPPTLPLPRKVANEHCAPRPGKKQLLLKSLLDNSNPEIKENKEQNEDNKALNILKKVTKKVIDRKGKRKDLPHALRRQLDKQQQEVIEAYKNIKLKKYSNT